MSVWDDHPDLVPWLRQYWDEGLSTAEIGCLLGVSKGAVIGKAHRLKLRPRPSPIKGARGGARSPRSVSTPKGVFDAIGIAAAVYGLHWKTVRRWATTGRNGFRFADPPR